MENKIGTIELFEDDKGIYISYIVLGTIEFGNDDGTWHRTKYLEEQDVKALQIFFNEINESTL